MRSIYLDAAASTPLLPEAWEAMRPFCLEHAGNPASSHHAGRKARQALEDAREQVAGLLDAFPDEVIFTSGATEANNLALLGTGLSTPGPIAVAGIEHPCVLEPIAKLRENGHSVQGLPVAHTGAVELDGWEPRADLRLATLMLANHETGAVQPVARLVSSLPEGVPCHCDAAAAAGKMSVSFRELGVTSLTVSAHKFHGPKGVGALLLRRRSRLRPLCHGGYQQQGRRPGTEAVPLAVGMATALAWCCKRLEQHTEHVTRLRQVFVDALRGAAAPIVVNGQGGLPHVANVSFPGCRADVLLMKLDLAGVACATGSACSSGSLLPSPVLQAMGVEEAALHSALRFSFHPMLSEADVAEASQRISQAVKELRRSSPC